MLVNTINVWYSLYVLRYTYDKHKRRWRWTIKIKFIAFNLFDQNVRERNNFVHFVYHFFFLFHVSFEFFSLSNSLLFSMFLIKTLHILYSKFIAFRQWYGWRSLYKIESSKRRLKYGNSFFFNGDLFIKQSNAHNSHIIITTIIIGAIPFTLFVRMGAWLKFLLVLFEFIFDETAASLGEWRARK